MMQGMCAGENRKLLSSTYAMRTVKGRTGRPLDSRT